MFFGDLWEVYGVSFSDSETIIPAFNAGAITPYGKIRHAYREMIGVPWDRKETVNTLKKEPFFSYVDCWITRDCDSPYHYTRIEIELLNRGILEVE